MDKLLVTKGWYGDRKDFTVVLQEAPLVTDLAPTAVSFRTVWDHLEPLYCDAILIPDWKTEPRAYFERCNDIGTGGNGFLMCIVSCQKQKSLILGFWGYSGKNKCLFLFL